MKIKHIGIKLSPLAASYFYYISSREHGQVVPIEATGTINEYIQSRLINSSKYFSNMEKDIKLPKKVCIEVTLSLDVENIQSLHTRRRLSHRSNMLIEQFILQKIYETLYELYSLVESFPPNKKNEKIHFTYDEVINSFLTKIKCDDVDIDSVKRELRRYTSNKRNGSWKRPFFNSATAI